MAKENPTWGYTRIRGALYNLGHDIGRNTLKRILLEVGLQPAPERSRRTSWSDFIPLGERQLRHILHEYVDHYHTERNHQALDN